MVDSRDRRAAVVCVHVALENRPILHAKWDPPDGPVDSGWQFLSSEGVDHASLGIGGARLWTVEEVLNREPTLRRLLDASRVRRCMRDMPEGPGRTFSPRDA
jgi:hypothetical protein